MASWLGLDLGEKRIGVAVADESTRLATPVTTFEIRGRKHLLNELIQLIDEYHVAKIVVGLAIADARVLLTPVLHSHQWPTLWIYLLYL